MFLGKNTRKTNDKTGLFPGRFRSGKGILRSCKFYSIIKSGKEIKAQYLPSKMINN
jgi:hypothetical protein